MKSLKFLIENLRVTLIFFIGLYHFHINTCFGDFPNETITLTVINDLHMRLDVNIDGVIDLKEVEKFVIEELNYEPNSEKINLFKNHITKEKLWNSWKSCEAYNWTSDDVIFWLIVHIDLPEYTNVFLFHNITGSIIPRLSQSNYIFLQNNLKIFNQEHCKKIAVKSNELILFGVPDDIENKFSKEKLAFDVVTQLHAQLDDNMDGGVDSQEANEFVRDELRYTTDLDRANGFNKNDNHISKEELWQSWKSSEVINWTSTDVLQWLTSYVDLPEYTEIFQLNNINGSFIPRLALSDMSYLIKDLKIINPVHRKKLILKSTDLILFGPPKKNYSKMKDVILFTFFILTGGGCWFAFLQHQHSKRQLKTMKEKMNELGRAEESLCTLQNRLEEAKIQNSKITSEKLEIEEKLKFNIEKYKEEIFRNDSNEHLFKNKNSEDLLFIQLNSDQTLSQNLKILLQITYEVEGHLFSIKRLAAEHQMQNVRDMCDRLRKKKNTFIGSLKMAHSGNLDDMDKQLSEAKHAIDEVRSDLTERSQRWECIEKLTKLKIFPTPGLITLRSTFNGYNGVGLMNRKHSIPTPISDVCSTLNINPNTAIESCEFNNYDTISSITRPRNLKFYMGNGSAEHFQDNGDRTSSLGAVDTITDVMETNNYPIHMPKSSSVSHSLFHLHSSPSQTSTSYDHHSSFSIFNGKSNHNTVFENENESQSNLNLNISQVRPFAFRWLKKLDKSKIPFKKSKPHM